MKQTITVPKGYILSYAQNKEDIIIRAFFPDVKKGFYIDIGANHPEEDSVTKLLYLEGWCGINVEPNVQLSKLLKEDRPKDITLTVGISQEAGELTFREYANHGLSTFSDATKTEHADEKDGEGLKYRDRVVPVVTLNHIFSSYAKGRTVQFLKIDIEGYEAAAIKGNDWQKNRPEMVCIEANHMQEDWRPLLTGHGYHLVFHDGINEYYLREESLYRNDFFNYAQAVILAGVVIGPGLARRIMQGEEDRYTARELGKENAKLKAEVVALRAELTDIHEKQKHNSYLLKQIAKNVSHTTGHGSNAS